jgi:hypothetical protein
MGRKKQDSNITERICTKCKENKSIDNFWKKKNGVYVSICKKCSAKAFKKYSTDTNYSRKRYWDNRDYERERHLIRKYGINFIDYKRILKQQMGVCAICGIPEPEHKMFDVDHDHKTGKVRGLLCTNCNRMLGHARDNGVILRNAADYLNSSASGISDI